MYAPAPAQSFVEKQSVRTHFKTPEGRYTLRSEKQNNLVTFQAHRTTRLTLATVQTGSDSGAWIIFNVGEGVHFCRPTATDKEPTRSVLINLGKQAIPTCHAFSLAKDGNDLLVGLSTGEVVLMSLRVQLQSNSANSKPTIASTFNAEGTLDATRCNAVAFVPKSDGTVFATAYASGNIYFFKKGSGSGGEGSSKFSLGLASKSTGPCSTWALGAGPINDIAFSPDGKYLAAAPRDGILRIVEVSTGVTVAGFQSYYGALLCCAWSSDGRYVAAGGEDDRVAVYGVMERTVQHWGEGHNSWISRVSFDPWLCTTIQSSSDLAAPERAYRVASVGQDAQLSLWDFVGDELVDQGPNTIATMPTGLRREGSGAPIARGSSNNLQELAGVYGSTTGRNGVAVTIAPSFKSTHTPSVIQVTHRRGMDIMPAVMQHRIHVEPLCDVLFTEDAVFTACHAGQIKCWTRPQPGAAGQVET